ncbi:hypothetical protein ACFX2I_037624 [Malus domestica]
MQRCLQSTFEAVSEDSSANVLLIRNNVSKVFCAGADLKVGILIMFFVKSMFFFSFKELVLDIQRILQIYVHFIEIMALICNVFHEFNVQGVRIYMRRKRGKKER